MAPDLSATERETTSSAELVGPAFPEEEEALARALLEDVEAGTVDDCFSATGVFLAGEFDFPFALALVLAPVFRAFATLESAGEEAVRVDDVEADDEELE